MRNSCSARESLRATRIRGNAKLPFETPRCTIRGTLCQGDFEKSTTTSPEVSGPALSPAIHTLAGFKVEESELSVWRELGNFKFMFIEESWRGERVGAREKLLG